MVHIVIYLGICFGRLICFMMETSISLRQGEMQNGLPLRGFRLS